MDMVKGVTRRVVVVKSPDRRLFEEAIFILSEEALRSGGITAEDIVSEACAVASTYVRKNTAAGLRKYLIPAALIGSGALILGICLIVGMVMG